METIVFLLVAGAVLLLVEPFIPHLISGSVGLILWAIGVLMIYQRYGISAGNWALVGVLSVALTGVWWYLKKLPQTSLVKGVRSEHVIPAETAAKTRLIDAEGLVVTPLRPGGLAQFGPDRIDVVTSGEPLEKGQKVRVVSVEGSRILVRAA